MKRTFLFTAIEGSGGGKTEKSELIIGQATDKELKEWKEKNVFGIFSVTKAGRIAYFKRPSLTEMDHYHAKAQKGTSVSDGWKALGDCFFIGGCRELIESPLYLPTVAKKIQEGIYGDEAELVNL